MDNPGDKKEDALQENSPTDTKDSPNGILTLLHSPIWINGKKNTSVYAEHPYPTDLEFVGRPTVGILQGCQGCSGHTLGLSPPGIL